MYEPSVKILFLSKKEIDSIITYEDVIRAVEDVFVADGNNQLVMPAKDKMFLDDEKTNILMPMPSFLKNINVAGMKWMRFFPKKPMGIPTLWGQLLILSDPVSGLPFAVMDATTITDMRTSGGHAVVAARYLAKKDSKVLSVLGCGAQGRAGIISFDKNFDLDYIKVYNRKSTSIEECKRFTDGKLRAKLLFVGSPEELMEGTDILLSATTSRTPLVKSEWIPEGCLVNAMSSFYDVDPKITKYADKWVLGHRFGDKIQIVDNPAIKPNLSYDDVYASLGEIICNRVKGRENDKERIVFSHMGMGALDISVGKRIYDIAVERGIGKKIRMI